MARQPMSMIGHMYAGVNKGLKAVIANPVVRFVGRTAVQMGERLIPQGAAEMASAIHTGSAFVQYGPTEHPATRGNVHGTAQAQVQAQPAAVQTPAIAPPAQQQALTASTYFVPQQTHQQMLAQAAARAPSAAQQQHGMER